MRWKITLVDEVRQPFLKLVEGIHDAITGKPRPPLCSESPLARYLGDGAVGCTIVVKRLAHDPRKSIAVILRNPDAAMHGGRTQVEQETFGLKDAMSFE